MQKLFVVYMAVVLLGMGCVKPEQETPSPAQQQTDIEEYLQRARRANELASEREKPLAIAPLIDTSRLTNVTQAPDLDFLKKSFERIRIGIQKHMQQSYEEKTKAALNQLTERYKQQQQEMIEQSVSPADLAGKLKALEVQQNQAIQQFISEQEKILRLKPDQELVEKTMQRLVHRCQEYVDNMRVYYGNKTAEEIRPVFEKAVQDFTHAITSAPEEKDLDEQVNQILARTTEQIQQIVPQTADPMGSTPEEFIITVRSQMIEQHQKLEKEIERLYGKEPVLQSRHVFNRSLQDGGAILRENMRLSAKKAALERLNQQYADSMRSLQQQWNLQRGVSTAPTNAR